MQLFNNKKLFRDTNSGTISLLTNNFFTARHKPTEAIVFECHYPAASSSKLYKPPILTSLIGQRSLLYPT